MTRFTPWLLAFALCLTSMPAFAGALDELRRFTDELTSLRATFVQTVYDEDQQPLQETTGIAELERPGLFRWEYREPFEQLIVGDGERLWVYEADLRQAQVKDVDEALGQAPISLLTGAAPLDEEFETRDLGRREGLEWVGLRPKTQDTEFTRIFLGFDENTIKVIELRDRFDQATQIIFDDVEMNPDIPAERFTFTPPDGVDVIGNTDY